MPVGWETHAAPDLSGRAQGIINDRLLKDCDLLIGVFWTKLGTPTGDYQSGTAEEIIRHVDAGKPAMVYFSDAPVSPASMDLKEYKKVGLFKKRLYDLGIVESFSNAAQFRDKFRQQLAIQINEQPYLKGILQNSVDEDAKALNSAEMTAEARELLVAASEDRSGHIMSVSTLSGRHIQTNGKTFGESGNARSSALWEAALNELSELGYVTPRGIKGEVFQITNSGYTKADQLKETSNVL